MNQLEQKIDAFIEENKEQFIEDVKTLVKIRSVKDTPAQGAPFGVGCKQALDKALELAEGYGFTVKNYGDQVGAAYFGDQEKHIAAIAHVDVVPEATGWIYEPYNPTIKDGYIIGRGVGDDKGPAVVAMYAMRFIKDNNLPMRHGLRLLFGSEEETGMTDVEYYLANEKAPVFTLTPDTSYPVCYGEKGIFRGDICSKKLADTHIVDFEAGVASNVVPDNAKLTLKNVDFQKVKDCESATVMVQKDGEHTVLLAKGTSAHAARPEGSINAIGEACKVAVASGQLNAEETQFMQMVIDLVKSYYGEALGVDCQDEVFGKLTCIAGIMKFENDQMVMNIDIRYPMAMKDTKLEELLEENAKKFGATLAVDSNRKPHYFNKDHPAVGLLTKLFNDAYGMDEKPYVTGGGTYARKFPNAIGFGLGVPGAENPMPEHHGGPHQPDEVAKLDDLYMAIKLYIKAFVELDKMDF